MRRLLCNKLKWFRQLHERFQLQKKIDDDGLASAISSEMSRVVRVSHRPTRMNIVSGLSFDWAPKPHTHVPCPNVRKVLVDPSQNTSAEN